MSFQILQTCFFRFFYKLCIQIRVSCYERNVHQRTGSFFYGSLEQFTFIQIIIQNLGFLFIALFHCFQTALFFQPFEYFTTDIDAVTVWCIIKRICISMCLIFHHGRSSRKHLFPDQILPYNHNRHTRRSYILLHTAVHDAVLCNVHRLRQKAGGNIRYKRDALRIRKGMKLRSVDRIVLTDVHIIRIPGSRQLTQIRDAGKILLLRGGCCFCLSVLLRFLPGFLCPLPGQNIVCLFVFHEIHRNHCKLQRCPSLQKQYLIVFRYV